MCINPCIYLWLANPDRSGAETHFWFRCYRTPNTAARLVNPFDAPAGVDGVFHPGYIKLHLATAERQRRERLVVVKGGGGEAERSPVKAMTAYWYERGQGESEMPLAARGTPQGEPTLLDVWQGSQGAGASVAAVRVGLALLARGRDPADLDAAEQDLWGHRHP